MPVAAELVEDTKQIEEPVAQAVAVMERRTVKDQLLEHLIQAAVAVVWVITPEITAQTEAVDW